MIRKRTTRPDTVKDGDKPAGTAEVPALRGEALEGFPWLPIGNTVIVLLDNRDTVKSKGGVFKVLSGSEKRQSGLIVAFGPGEFLAYVGFVSPSVHYGLRLRDLVWCRMDCGDPLNVDGIQYIIYRPEDIACRANDKVAVRTREELIERLKDGLAQHIELGEEAGESTTVSHAPPLPDRPPMEEEIGEHMERRMSERGKATKTQILVPRKE